MASIDVSTGMTLEYDIRGEGEPILFVMGLAGQLIDYEEEFVDLFVAEGHQAIRFDNRDVGLSTQTDWEPPSQNRSIFSMLARRPLKGVGYTVEDMAADAAALLEALGIESAHIVGVSMGGMITQAMAINHPSKVKSICSIMSNTGDRKNGGIAFSLMRKLGRRPEPTLDNFVDLSVTTFEAISGEHFDDETHRKQAHEGMTRSFTPEGVARQTAAIGGSPNRTKRLRNVTVPALVIHGLQDPLVKPTGGIATAQAIPGSRLLMFGDMGHDLPRPRWHEIRDAILQNIGRV
ncbi:MAG: alpha/beta hydrolase [Acidimicrobiales bacterium]|jgi:pimeloyl-ACP methyl ester carboxylesterase|nr:alpha/beta hydrolase [Acidimicrobiales bacterium]